MTLPERIHERRKAAGLTQEQAGELAGVPQPQWSDWERGRWGERLTLQTLRKIAKGLGCTVGELID